MASDKKVQIQRATRIDIKLDLEFFSPVGHATGYSVNLRESGLLGLFEKRLDIWTTGDLRISIGDEHWTFEARVARIAEDGVAFSFRNLQEDARTELRKLILDRLTNPDALQMK